MTTTTFSQTITSSYIETQFQPSFFAKFINWCNDQNQNRLLWIGVILAAHGCVLTPLTAMAVLFTGLNFPLVMLAIIAMAMVLVTNLAALPTKYTIPVFALSILIDLGIILSVLFIASV